MIMGADGKTVGTCNNCRYYQITSPGNCQRYPTFVQRQSIDTCGDWAPDDATAQTITLTLISQANSAINSTGNPAPPTPGT